MTHLRHTWNFGDAHLAALNPDPDEPPMSLWMVQRIIFDNALTQRAAQAGCDVRDGLAVKSVAPEGESSVRVTTADGDVYHGLPCHRRGRGERDCRPHGGPAESRGCWRLRWKPKSRMTGGRDMRRCARKWPT